MKTKHLLLSLLALLGSTTLHAYDAYIDGLYYNFNASDGTATLMHNSDTHIRSITIPANVTYNSTTYSVTSIGDLAFNDCSDLTSVTIPNSVTSIGNYAFEDCRGLTSVNIPEGVTSIGNSAFKGCRSLTSVNIPNSVTSIGDNAFYDTPWDNNLPDGLVYAGKVAYKYKGTMPAGTKITLENGTIEIASHAFHDCSGLTSVTIPNSVTSIGGGAFKNCSGLTSITIPNNVTSIGGEAFYDCILSSITIGAKVSSIGSSAFHNPTSYRTKVIWLPKTPPTGYTEANGTVNYTVNDQYTDLTNVTVYPYLASMFEVGGIKYVPVNPSERTCDAIDCVYDESAENIDIGETVTYRGVAMTVQQIKQNLLYRNKFTKDVRLSNLITYIGKDTFSECSNLENIVIPNSVTTIGDYVFNCCYSLSTIQIPQGVTTIGDYAFNGCTGLRNVLIADGGTELNLGCHGSYPLFAECPLDVVYIGRNITYPTGSDKGYSPFYGNTSLRSLTIAANETEVTANEFAGCTSLEEVSIGDGVTSIGNNAFSGCSSMESFTFGSGVESIGQEAFSDCTALTSLVSRAATPPTCGSQALFDINKWDCTLTVPQGSASAYLQADQWEEFFFVEEAAGETPVIAVKDDITIGSTGYATYCSTHNLDFSGVTGLKAYIASGFSPSTGKLVLTRVDEVPAGEGLYLVGDPGTYEVPTTTTDMMFSNLLKGVTTATTIYPTEGGYTNFILSNGSYGVGFYTLSESGELAAGKAYLQLPTASVSNVKAINLIFDDDDPTALQGIEDYTTAKDIYNLQGQKVSTPRNGLFIINGKKVLYK